MTVTERIRDALNATFDDAVGKVVPDVMKGGFNLILGVIYLILALLVAWLVKAIVVAVLRKVGVERKLNKLAARGATAESGAQQTGTRVLRIIGKLVFLLIFLLFLPAVLDKFGMEGATAPISRLLNSFVAYLPRIIACVVILVVGFFIANLIRQIVVALVGATKIDRLQEKLSKGKFHFDIPKLIGTVLYVVIAAIVLICGLNVLNIEAISQPAAALLSAVIGAIPAILVALIVLFVGVFLANLVGSLLESLLSSFGIDERLNKWLNEGKEEKDAKEVRNIGFIAILVGVVKTVIIVLFAVEAVNLLRLKVLTTVGEAVIGFLPAALVAVIVCLAAYFICRVLDARTGLPALALKVAKAAVWTVAGFIALSQIGIAPAIVNTAFIVIIVAMGVAFAVAAGIGGIPFFKNLFGQIRIGKGKDAAEEDEKKDDH